MEENVEGFERYLKEHEHSENTIRKYVRDIRAFFEFLGARGVNKENTLLYKNHLTKRYAPSSVNSMLAALNSYLEYSGRKDCRVRTLKIQKKLFLSENKELSEKEYARLVRAAEDGGDKRLSLIIQTICSTGIRVSELRYITVSSLRDKRAVISCKGKYRVIFLPEGLCAVLKKYVKAKKNHRRRGVYYKKRQTRRPLAYLAGNEETLREGERGS